MINQGDSLVLWLFMWLFIRRQHRDNVDIYVASPGPSDDGPFDIIVDGSSGFIVPYTLCFCAPVAADDGLWGRKSRGCGLAWSRCR